MNSVIRRLQTREEYRALAVIFSEVFETGVTPSTEHLEAIGSSSHACIIGAFVDGELVGGLAAYELPVFSGAKEFCLYDIAVKREHQNRGLGKKLIDALKHEAHLRGVTNIFVEAEADDAGAVGFYRSLGGEEVAVAHFNLPVR